MEESLEVIESIPERIDAEIEGSSSVPDEIVEIIFRQFISKQTPVVSTIPCDTLCNEAMESPLLTSLWEKHFTGMQRLTKTNYQALSLKYYKTLYKSSQFFLCLRLH